MKKLKPKTIIAISLILLIAITVYIFRNKIFGTKEQNTNIPKVGTTGKTINRDKVVKKGDINNEVLEIQILMNEELKNHRTPTFLVTLAEDSNFGTKTETRLNLLTNKNSISINELIIEMPKTRQPTV